MNGSRSGIRVLSLSGGSRTAVAAAAAIAIAGLVFTPGAAKADGSAPAVAGPGELLQAAGNYDRRVESRMQSASRRARIELADAARELEARLRARHVTDAKPATPGAPDDLGRLVRRHLQQGTHLVAGADRQRSLAAQYRGTENSVMARMADSADRGWKILGRVVRRRGTLDLERATEELRVHAERVLAADVRDSEAGAPGGSIDAVLALLAAQADELTRVEGDGWLEQLRSDLARMRALERQLDALGRAQHAALMAFRGAGLTLAVQVQASYAGPVQAPPPVRAVAAAMPAGITATGGTPLLQAGALLSLALLLAVMRRVAYRQRNGRDPLTGLPDRRQLLHRLQRLLEQAAPAQRRVVVLCIDLDNFHSINDSIGREFGDRVLTSIAARVMDVAGARAFAARAGGDKFAVVHEAGGGNTDAGDTARRLLQAFAAPLEIDARQLCVSISVGAAVFPDHAVSPEALLCAADAAVFHAKTAGRSRLTLFSPPLLEAASMRFRIAQELRGAIQRDELELVYQPQVAADSSAVAALEALVRWRLPDGTLALPGTFLGVAEETGLIRDIGDWVLRRAIQTAARWHRERLAVRVAINVTAGQLLEGGFVARLGALLAAEALPARCIELELTEGALQTGAATVAVLRALHERGIAIALDDFGTGYSSLASLEQLPLSRVKLDRSLIAGIHTSERAREIASSIVALCRKLGLGITAEGIEHMEQLRQLASAPGMHLQGFLIAKPVRTVQVPEVVAAMPRHMATLLPPETPVTAPARIPRRQAAPRKTKVLPAPEAVLQAASGAPT